MRELLILRHAKSSWKFPELADHDRPLNKRGRRDAPRMGAHIDAEGWTPDHILCSTAARAMQTAERVRNAMDYRGVVAPTRALYHADEQAICGVLRACGEPHHRLLLVGHNPGLEGLISQWTGRHEVFPTAALAVVRAHIDDWSALRLNSEVTLLGLWRPKEL